MAEERDFIGRIFDRLDQLTDAVHDKVLRPVILAGRAAAYGFVIFFASLIVFVAALIGVPRLLTVYAFGGRVWATDLLVGVILCAGGLVLWWRRRPAAA